MHILSSLRFFLPIAVFCVSLQCIYAWDSPIAIPDIGTPRLRIVGQNAENYVHNFESTNASASTEDAFVEKTQKMANVFLALQADIVAICEVEVNDTILGYICAAMNEISETSVYTFVKDGYDETTTGPVYAGIKAGFIYRSDKVEPLGESTSPYTTDYWLYRLRVQPFRELLTGEIFTLSMNHFKAKNDGESIRIQNADSLISHLANIQYDPDILIMGDLNATISSTPIQMLITGGYEEQMERFDELTGQGTLNIDHAMANSSMAGQITGAAPYRINTSGLGSQYKFSDHDAYVVGLNLGGEDLGPRIRITFDANGGKGTMYSQSMPQSTERNLSTCTFTREHYHFAGWAITADGEKVYNDGDAANFDTDTTLYAVWEENIVHFVHWSADGVIIVTDNIDYGEQAVAPATNPANCSEKRVFVGWTSNSNFSDEPELLSAAPTIICDTTFSAVYADTTITDGGSGSDSYVFTTNAWNAISNDLSADWSSGKDGNAFINNGVQVTSGTSGANATCPDEYVGVQSIVVSYCTNSTKGSGSVTMSVGETQITKDVTSAGGTNPRDLTFDFSTTAPSGNPQITVNCTTNSIYICGITIYYAASTTNYDHYAVLCDPEQVATSISNTKIQPSAQKVLINNQLFILREDKIYTIQGTLVR